MSPLPNSNSSGGLDAFLSLDQIYKEVKDELLFEVRDILKEKMNFKVLKVIALAKERAGKVIEEERLANKEGWFESLAKDVSPIEFERYLGLTNYQDNIIFDQQQKKSENVKKSERPSSIVDPLPPPPPLPVGPTAPSSQSYAAKKEETSKGGLFSNTTIPKANSQPFDSKKFENPTFSLGSSSSQTQPKSREDFNPEVAVKQITRLYVGLLHLRKAFLNKPEQKAQVQELEQLFTNCIGPSLKSAPQSASNKTASSSPEATEMINRLNSLRGQPSRATYIFALDQIAQKFVNFLALIPSNNHTLHSQLASAGTSLLFGDHAEQFREVLLANIYSSCPSLIPSTKPNIVFPATGFAQPKSNYKPTNLFSFYCAYMLDHSNMASTWAWLAMMVSAPPTELNGYCLRILLERSGSQLVAVYKDQALKLIRSLATGLVPKLPSHLQPELKATIIRLVRLGIDHHALKLKTQTA